MIDLGYLQKTFTENPAPLALKIPEYAQMEFMRIVSADELLSEKGKPDQKQYQLPHGVIRMQIRDQKVSGKPLTIALQYDDFVKPGTRVYQVNGDGFKPLKHVRVKGKKVYFLLQDGGLSDHDRQRDGMITTSLAVMTPVQVEPYDKLENAVAGRSLWSILMMYRQLGY